MLTSPLSELKVDEWNQMIDVNLKGVTNSLAAILPTFISQKYGHVITTSSVAGLNAYPGAGIYGATKFAVRDLMEVLRMESAAEGSNIRTTTLYPGAINTELVSHISGAKTKSDMAGLYAQVGISPAAVASAVNFAIDQPEDVEMHELTIYPTKQG